MSSFFRSAFALVVAGLVVSPVKGHFNMLLLEPASAKRGAVVTVLYRWGHPFEHQLFDAPAPEAVFAVSPAGDKADLRPSLEKTTETADQKPVTTYRCRFTPGQRGDYLLILNTPPIWMEEDQEFLQDTVKVVLHVQAQNGWDKAAGEGLEVMPLTRPYGLQPGMAFQAQVLAEGKPLAGALIEIEHYHPAPPSKLPPDEHITRTVKTDPSGGFVCTLTEPGWWCLTAERDAGRREHDAKTYPVRRRATLWVFVDGAIRFEIRDAGAASPKGDPPPSTGRLHPATPPPLP
jgi:cobalt/nickel transport protein